MPNYPGYTMPPLTAAQRQAYAAARSAGFSDWIIQRFMANNGQEDLLRVMDALDRSQDPYFGGVTNPTVLASETRSGNTAAQEAFIATLNTGGALDPGSGFDRSFQPGETNAQYAARLDAWKHHSALAVVADPSHPDNAPALWTSAPELPIGYEPGPGMITTGTPITWRPDPTDSVLTGSGDLHMVTTGGGGPMSITRSPAPGIATVTSVLPASGVPPWAILAAIAALAFFFLRDR